MVHFALECWFFSRKFDLTDSKERISESHLSFEAECPESKKPSFPTLQGDCRESCNQKRSNNSSGDASESNKIDENQCG